MGSIRFANLVSHLAGLFRWLFNLFVPHLCCSRSLIGGCVCFPLAHRLSLRTNALVALTWRVELAELGANKALHPTAYSPLVPRSLSAAGELSR